MKDAQTTLLALSQVVIGQRHRQDMGDIKTLAASIESLGLLQPIGVTPDFQLIWGHRRLEAVRQLGWYTIAARVVPMDDIVLGEYAENEVRKDFTTSEKVAIGAEVERILGERRGNITGSNQYKLKSGNRENFPTFHKGLRNRDIAAQKTGFGNGKTYQQAKSVVENGVPELVQVMDDGKVSISVAAEVATLSKDKQRVLVELNRKEILKAAKTIRQEKSQERQQLLEQAKERQAEQVRARPSAPIVVCQDALAFLESQPEFDLLLTDPPYSTEIEDIHSFARSWLPMALEKMKPTGRAYVFIGAYPQELLAYLSVAMPDQVLVWTYRNTLGPSPNGRYKQNWQAVLYYKGRDAPNLDCPELNELFSVHDIPAPDGRHYNRLHPWQKPDAIAERFVRHASHEQDRVIDPFCCTGTFLLAASKYGRQAIGCDISQDSLDIALSRGCRYDLHH